MARKKSSGDKESADVRRDKVITRLTGVIVAAWLASLSVRVSHPDLGSVFSGLDGIALTVVGYWFITKRVNGGGDSIADAKDSAKSEDSDGKGGTP